MNTSELPLTEQLDFHYILQLMPPISDIPEFALLPELFSILGYEKLILLCKYAGSEIVKIPSLDELSRCIQSLQWFYSVYITKKANSDSIPPDLIYLVNKIKDKYNA